MVNLRLEVPTVKGARNKAPSYMVFDVTSESPDDITGFVGKVKALTHSADLVLVSQTSL